MNATEHAEAPETTEAPNTRKPKAKAAKGRAKPEANGRPEVAGHKLRSAQVRILKALAKAPLGLGKVALEKKAEVNPAWLADMAGRLDAKVAARAEKSYGFPSLATLGLVKVEAIETDGSTRKELFFSLKAKGKKLAATI